MKLNHALISLAGGILLAGCGRDAGSSARARSRPATEQEKEEALAELRDQRILLGWKFEELKHASDDAWDKTKPRFVAAWSETTKTYDNARSRVY